MSTGTPQISTATTAPAALAVPVRRRWLGALLAVGVVLGVVSAVLQLAKHGGWRNPSLQLDRLLNIDEDLSILNWLTASTFLLAGVVGYAAATRQRAQRLGWFVAVGALVFVSLDEAAQVHDPITEAAKDQLRAGGLRAGVILVVAVTVAAVSVRFLLRLDPPVRWRVAGATVLVLVAAVGIDSVGPDLVNDPAARLKPGYVAKSTVEEVIELSGSVLILDGMLVAAIKR